MRFLVPVAVVLALAIGGHAPGAPGAEPAGALTLEQQVGQLLVLSFRGTTAPAYVREALGERRAAGVILFEGNIDSPAQLRRLTVDLRRGSWRPLVAVDQEGGADFHDNSAKVGERRGCAGHGSGSHGR